MGVLKIIGDILSFCLYAGLLIAGLWQGFNGNFDKGAFLLLAAMISPVHDWRRSRTTSNASSGKDG